VLDEQQVNPVQKLYMDLSGRYKAGWTFHRFIQGLRKFFGSQELEDHTPEFQELYQGLKETSRRLNDAHIQPVISRLEEIQDRLQAILQILDEEDRRITPSLVRLFFQRVKGYDERIVLDLVRFYLEIQRGRSWDEERIDKVDFLLSRLGEAIAGEDLMRDKSRLHRVLESIATGRLGTVSVDPQKLANRQMMIQAVRNEIGELASFEDLTGRDLVGHYRNVKHGLGSLMFEKSILPAVVDTNLMLAAKIGELTHIEERRILEDYERVARLEEQGGVDDQLGASVSRLHEQVSRFRRQIEARNVRIADVAALRGSVLEILERLEACAAESKSGAAMEEIAPLPSRLKAAEVLPGLEEQELLEGAFAELVGALEAEQGSAEGAIPSSVLAFRLDDRERLAFERLVGAESCDERLERFVLGAAALRFRINEEVGEIHAHRGRSGADGEPVAETTRRLLAAGDWFLRQFDHFLAGDASRDAASRHRLEQLRMRLMRDYSGLWLVAYS
jgi:hypothetical protein